MGRIDYRVWAARAAQEALATAHGNTRKRCADSATVWNSIADAVDAGDAAKVARLTRNLSFWTAP